MVDAICSDKSAADTRPEWVKNILRGGYKVTAFFDFGRWYFEPTIPNSDLPVGYVVYLYKDGEKIPSIWDGEHFRDLRTATGRALYGTTKVVLAR